MNVATKITIQSVQANTKQESKGFWSTVLNGKTIGNIHKLTTGGYGVSVDMSEHTTFMKALGHMVKFVKAAAQPSRTVKAVFSFAVMAAVMAPAAQAATPAAYNQFQHGATQFNTLPEDAPVNQVTDAYNEALAGLNRMGITGQNQDDLIANYSNLSDYQSAFKWAGVQVPADVVSVPMILVTDTASKPMTTITNTATKPAASVEDVAQNTKDIADNSGLIRAVAKGVTTNTDAIAQAQDTAQNAQQIAEGVALVDANRQRTASQHVAPVAPLNGADGKDGVTTTVTKVQVDTATQAQVQGNSASIRGVRSEVQTQGQFIQQNRQVINQHSAQITANSKRIDQNSKDISDTRESLKRGLNNAAAMTGLHYHSNDSYAVSAGTANGDGAAIAGGLSKSITQHTAATMQGSTSQGGDWMASVGFSGDF